MTSLEKLEKRVIFERLVIGLEEPVLIKGIGEIQAKVDSGNGGYNVLHGTDIYEEGDMLHFTTVDGQGNPKHVATKLIDRLQVNIGGGHIQDRPVVELDIKFANTLYKKIPFSITDRSDNDLKILIAKSFVDDELNALIDVGEVNISKNNVQVDTVNESILTEADNNNDWKSLNVGTVSDQTDARRFLAKLDSVLFDLEQTSGGVSSQDYNLAKNKFEQLYKKNNGVKMNFNSDYASRFAPQTSSTKPITTKGKEQGMEALNGGIRDATDVFITVGFRMMALYIAFEQKKEEIEQQAKEEEDENKRIDLQSQVDEADNWLEPKKKKINSLFKKAYTLLKNRKESFRQKVRRWAGGGNLTTEGVMDAVKNVAKNATVGAVNVMKPEERGTSSDKKHEQFMNNLRRNMGEFNNRRNVDVHELLQLTFADAQKPNIEKFEDIEEEIDSHIITAQSALKNVEGLEAKMSEAIQHDVDEGFWTSLNRRLEEMAQACDQIYRGTYSGSLIGNSIGFIKKWMAGGGTLSKFLKGASLAVAVANPPLAVPLLIAYAVQQTRRKIKANELDVNLSDVRRFKEQLDKQAATAKEITNKINKTVADRATIIKEDQKIISDFMNEDESGERLFSNAAGEILGKGGDYKNPNLGADGLFPFFDYIGQNAKGEFVDDGEMGNQLKFVAETGANVKKINEGGEEKGEGKGKSQGEKPVEQGEVEQGEETIFYDEQSRELFEFYCEQAGRVLNEVVENTENQQPNQQEQGQEKAEESTVSVEDFEEITSTISEQLKEFQGFLGELQRRRQLMMYYVPIEEKGGMREAIKNTLGGEDFQKRVRGFYDRQRFNKRLMSKVLDEMVKTLKTIKGQGVGSIVLVWNGKSKREVITGLEKKVYVFGIGEEEKTEEKKKSVNIEEITKQIPSLDEFKGMLSDGGVQKTIDIEQVVSSMPTIDEFKKKLTQKQQKNVDFQKIVERLPDLNYFKRVLNGNVSANGKERDNVAKMKGILNSMPDKDAFVSKYIK